jgi:hypothetical protein
MDEKEMKQQLDEERLIKMRVELADIQSRIRQFDIEHRDLQKEILVTHTNLIDLQAQNRIGRALLAKHGIPVPIPHN